jgi:fatty-acyl-CoA synthase
MASKTEEPGIEPIGGLSQVRGDPHALLSEQSIPALLADTVARFGERPAVLFREQGIRWSWREFAAVVDELAAGLLSLGLERGDRLGIWSPNRAEWLVTQFATARIGVILVNINPAYRLSELEYALNVSGCRAIVTAERLKSSMYLQMLQTLAPELAHSEPGALKAATLPALQWVIRMGADTTPGMLNYDALLQRGRASVQTRQLDAISAQLGCHDPINIQFTSGTTGNPKGATLTHHNMLNNARFIAQCMRFSEDDSLCIPGAAVPLLRHGAGRAGLHDAAARAWSSPARPSSRWRRCRRWPRSAAPPCTACRRCSSPSWTIRASPSSTCPACAPASWPARRARSRP